MGTNIKINHQQRLVDLYQSLRIQLDWVSPNIIQLASKFSGLPELTLKQTVDYCLVKVNDLKSYITENKDCCVHNLYAFLTYLGTGSFKRDISFGAAAGILTRDAVDKLSESRFFNTGGQIDDAYYNAHSNCFTLSYDGGKPFLYKGIYKRKCLEDGNFFYFVLQ